VSDSDGNLVLPEELPYGDYLLHEVKAPNNHLTGYVLNTSDVPFSVTERHDFDNPLVVSMEDSSAKAIIAINKQGKTSKKPIAGAEYSISADGDIVTLDGTVHALDGEIVGTLVTDEEGNARSDQLYLGNYIVKETLAPDGYLVDETEYRVDLVYKDQETELITESLNLVDTEVCIEATKFDKSTQEPLADTEFTLYRESSAGAEDWAVVDTLVTDGDGKVVFSPVIKGSYRLVESRPNPAYASNEESGEQGARYITIDENSTEEVQIFHDEKIQLSCETFKDTINITSAGFRTFDDDYLRIVNVGNEQYHYTLDFRSTSNVRADEFTVVDPLNEVATGSVRIKELFTPVTQGDTDGTFNLWYQTNYTDTAQVYSEASAMRTNPYNPNNPQNVQNWPSTGWQLWQEGLPATSSVRLSIEDLGLASDEYITAFRYEYGSVEVGFTTRDTAKQALQQSKELKSTFSDWSAAPVAANGSADPVAASGSFTLLGASSLEPATYLVECSAALLPPTLISGSASVYIARNRVLSDDDRDTVKTTVIEPFMVSTQSVPPTDISTLEGFSKPGAGGLPKTGDITSVVAYAIATVLLALAIGLRFKRNSIQRKGRES
jgi:LPXTG-motif cell wall-anchored protein